MSKHESTLRDSVNGDSHPASSKPLPGLSLIFSNGRPQCVSLALTRGVQEIGRGEPSLFPVDPKMSRRHFSVAFERERFHIIDHGSQNGTFADGVRISQSLTTGSARVLRAGDSLFLLSSNVCPLQRQGVVVRDGVVLGPTLQAAYAQVALATQLGRTLHITGESGSGKEGLARAFHAASRCASGPFVAVNCATITPNVAERLLFGARRGAYSGSVADTEGLVQAADGGTLFLDEIGELDLSVQAKLLRALESGEVLPLGALKPRQVRIQLCSATNRELRAELSSGRFREDLYFRISIPQLVVPPLRQRPEEIPWIIEQALLPISAQLEVHSTFVDACLLRAWPGNVRELLAEVRAAAQVAIGSKSHKLTGQHLGAAAGRAIERPAEPSAELGCVVMAHPPIRKAPLRDLPERTRIEEALALAGGNISAAARVLGLHRTQLKRMLDKLGITLGRADQSLDSDTSDEE